MERAFSEALGGSTRKLMGKVSRLTPSIGGK